MYMSTPRLDGPHRPASEKCWTRNPDDRCDIVQGEIVLLLIPHEGNLFAEADARADAVEGDPACEAGAAECRRKRESKDQMQEL